MLQCAKCHLIFALPPLKGDSTRKWAEEQLRKELLRHVQESHQEDFSQAAVRIVREATEQKQIPFAAMTTALPHCGDQKSA
jgi:molybdopterin-guanine dinucleotide biosynthesis protein A